MTVAQAELDWVFEMAVDFLHRGAPDKHDGSGFNKVSFPAVYNLVNKSVRAYHDYERMCYHLIRHGKQLAPSQVEKLKDIKAQIDSFPFAAKLDESTESLVVTMPYNEKHVALMRGIYGGAYREGANYIPLYSAISLARQFNEEIEGFTQMISAALKPLTGKDIKARYPIEVKKAEAFRLEKKEGQNKVKEAKEAKTEVAIWFNGNSEMLEISTSRYDAEVHAAIKSLPSHLRAWDGSNKKWNVSPEAHNALIGNLKKTAAEYTTTAQGVADQYTQYAPVDYEAIAAAIDTTEALKVVNERFAVVNGRSLFQHQKEGVAFMLTVKNDKGMNVCINADDMGLGKSLESIIATRIQREKLDNSPVMVVVPASLKFNWVRELYGWLGKDAGIVQVVGVRKTMSFMYADNHNGFKPIKPNSKQSAGLAAKGIKGATKADYIIVNYDILEKLREDLNEWKSQNNCQIIILDEAHYIKNKDSSRTKAVLGFNKKYKKKIKLKNGEEKERTVTETHAGIISGTSVRYLLTGTPVTGKNRDMFSLLKAIEHDLAANERYFLQRYCGLERTPFGEVANESVNSDELFSIAATNMIQRQKKDVLSDFPSKFRQYHYVDVDTDAYWSYWDNYVSTYEERTGRVFNHNAAQLTELSVLRRHASTLKIDSVIEMAEEISMTRKVIVFTGYTETAESVKNKFGDKAVMIVGGMGDKAKDAAVQAFQNDDNISVIVCNMKAAAVGLTLTAATDIIMADLSWLPSDHFQAEDRAYRIGQNENVIIHYLIANNTHEEAVKRAIDEKARVIEQMEMKTYEVAADWRETFAMFLDQIKEIRQ